MSLLDALRSRLGGLRSRLDGLVTWTPHQRASRAVVKTALYRVFMVAITIVVAYGFTGSTTNAVGIGIISNVIKTGTYYGYERLWDRITWGI